MNLFLGLAIIFAISTIVLYVTSLGNNNLLDLHLANPLAIIPCMVTLVLLAIGIIAINPTIILPITIVYFVIGYLLSLRWFGMFINSRSKSTKETILKYNISKYFFPILIIYFWPLIIVSLILCKLTTNLQLRTPGKIFDEIKKKG